MKRANAKLLRAFLWVWIALAIACVAGWVFVGPSWLYGIMFAVALLNSLAWALALRKARGDERAPEAGA